MTRPGTGARLIRALAGSLGTGPVLLLAAVCLLPPLLIVVLSMFADGERDFPPQVLSLARYVDLFHSQKWGSALRASLALCVPAALVCVTLTLAAVIALEKGRVRCQAALESLAFMPIIIPGTSLAIGLYLVFLRTHLIGHAGPLVLVEAVNAIPVTFVVLRTGLRRIDPRIEQAALSLGASRPRVLLDITLPLLLPAIATALVFSFLTAFDDAMFVTFLRGRLPNTVSAEIFNSLRFQLDPSVGPLSALLMILMALPVAVLSGWRTNR
jgi:ABC-type spermidine/putrescine transport system permease subunit II